jgi:hypothetical protein
MTSARGWPSLACAEPDAHARRCANDAIDAMLADLHAVRSRLVSEIRESGDDAAARADTLLARTRNLARQVTPPDTARRTFLTCLT